MRKVSAFSLTRSETSVLNFGSPPARKNKSDPKLANCCLISVVNSPDELSYLSKSRISALYSSFILLLTVGTVLFITPWYELMPAYTVNAKNEITTSTILVFRDKFIFFICVYFL